ncbi:hypothetical protein [Streptomyces sindenensis]|uniref:Uncharacterized protein n=2 Tax=Streptomyces TaxID=1883 RepID=A0ABW6EYW5_9ACTN
MRDGAGRTAQAAWRDHAAAALTAAVPGPQRQALAQLAAAAGELAEERPRAALTLSRHLRDLAALIEPLAVAGALAHHVTWDTIGADLGQSRQAVNSRYVKPSADLSDRVHRLTGRSVEELLNLARGRGAPPCEAVTWTEEIHRLLSSSEQDQEHAEPVTQ